MIRYEVVDRLREISEAPPRRVFEVTPATAAALALGVLAAGLWFSLSAGLMMAAPRPLEPAYEASSLRRAMAMTAGRIDEFTRSHARLPSELAEIDRHPWALMEYERVSDQRYRLTAPSSSGPIVFDSMRPREDWIEKRWEPLRKDPTGPRP